MDKFLTRARVPGGGAQGRLGGPGPPGGLGGGTGQAGHRCAHLPSPPGADRPGPHRLSNDYLLGKTVDYSVYVMRQASRRSWRIGQKRPVKVVFMAYRNTLQADALKLVAKKLQSSLAVEGELPEDGLAAFGDDGDDLMLALARQIVNGDESDADGESVEDVFATARDAEGQRRGVPGGRRMEGGSGGTGSRRGQRERDHGNGHHRRHRNSTTVELVRANGHANGNGNGNSMRNPPRGSSPCSPGRSSWPANRPSPGDGTASRRPLPPPCSSGHWTRNRRREPVGAEALVTGCQLATDEGGSRRFIGGVPSSHQLLPFLAGTPHQATNRNHNQ